MRITAIPLASALAQVRQTEQAAEIILARVDGAPGPLVIQGEADLQELYAAIGSALRGVDGLMPAARETVSRIHDEDDESPAPPAPEPAGEEAAADFTLQKGEGRGKWLIIDRDGLQVGPVYASKDAARRECDKLNRLAAEDIPPVDSAAPPEPEPFSESEPAREFLEGLTDEEPAPVPIADHLAELEAAAEAAIEPDASLAQAPEPPTWEQEEPPFMPKEPALSAPAFAPGEIVNWDPFVDSLSGREIAGGFGVVDRLAPASVLVYRRGEVDPGLDVWIPKANLRPGESLAVEGDPLVDADVAALKLRPLRARGVLNAQIYPELYRFGVNRISLIRESQFEALVARLEAGLGAAEAPEELPI